ncbi:hypothetical protein GX51_01193 [Blastomyces parvus]|uniref:Uncharacterized protein n=1 Tax=Blastomyces parvus TaxID=2060905 RepID=A0A2B7XIA9_9EURO|nr:hypothetical protein GX51_01193 [Blastomyces parvus]
MIGQRGARRSISDLDSKIISDQLSVESRIIMNGPRFGALTSHLLLIVLVLHHCGRITGEIGSPRPIGPKNSALQDHMSLKESSAHLWTSQRDAPRPTADLHGPPTGSNQTIPGYLNGSLQSLWTISTRSSKQFFQASNDQPWKRKKQALGIAKDKRNADAEIQYSTGLTDTVPMYHPVLSMPLAETTNKVNGPGPVGFVHFLTLTLAHLPTRSLAGRDPCWLRFHWCLLLETAS